MSLLDTAQLLNFACFYSLRSERFHLSECVRMLLQLQQNGEQPLSVAMFGYALQRKLCLKGCLYYVVPMIM